MVNKKMKVAAHQPAFGKVDHVETRIHHESQFVDMPPRYKVFQQKSIHHGEVCTELNHWNQIMLAVT